MPENSPTIAALNVGNTNISFGKCDGTKVTDVTGLPVSAIDELVTMLSELDVDVVALASVNATASDEIVSAIEKTNGPRVYRMGRDLPISITHSLTDEALAKTGQDRLLCALGGYGLVDQACVVVDAGTAVTVDFIDGEGIFHGGAIAPGAAMQLRSLAEWTDSLPMLTPEKPLGKAIGADTFGAMQRGVYYGIRGMVRHLVEVYAGEYEGYPLVIATGGDAPMLFSDDELVDRVVPELALLGIARCVHEAMDDDAIDTPRLNGHSDN